MEEIWKDVVGYEGIYVVNNYGIVKSLDRNITRSNGIVYFKKGKIIETAKNQDGYLQFKLCKNGKYHTVRVHKIVAYAFLGPPPSDKYEINHKDCNRVNNCVSNLEWMLHKDNIKYSITCGNHICTSNLYGANNPNYNNHKLAAYFKEHPECLQNQARHGSHNGRAKPVVATYMDGESISFGYIRECACYLKDKLALNNSINNLADKIVNSIQTRTNLYDFMFDFK